MAHALLRSFPNFYVAHPTLIARRPLHVVDHQELARGSAGFEAEPKLFAHHRRRRGAGIARSVLGRGRRGLLDMNVVDAGETGTIDHRPAGDQQGRERIEGDPVASSIVPFLNRFGNPQT